LPNCGINRLSTDKITESTDPAAEIGASNRYEIIRLTCPWIGQAVLGIYHQSITKTPKSITEGAGRLRLD